MENIQIRCAGHNQHAAERTFGTGFMEEKRAEARRVAAEARAHAATLDQARDVMACLRELGFRAAEFCATLPDVTLEERVRAALKFMCP